MAKLGISEKLGLASETNTTPGGYANGLVADGTGATYQSTGNI